MTLDPKIIVPRLERKLIQLRTGGNGVIFFTDEATGVGIDLDRRAHNRMCNKKRKQRRRIRRLQMLRDHTYRALSRLTVRHWSRIAHVSNENTLGHITARQMWRELAKFYIVRARLGR